MATAASHKCESGRLFDIRRPPSPNEMLADSSARARNAWLCVTWRQIESADDGMERPFSKSCEIIFDKLIS